MDRKKKSASLELVPALLGFVILSLAVLLDKHSLGLKAIMSLALEAVILFLIAVQFRRRILVEKRIILGLFLIVSLPLTFYLSVQYRLWSSLNYIRLMYLILSQIPAFLLLFLYSLSDALAEPLDSYYETQSKRINVMALLGIFLSGALVFFLSPLTVYASDPGSLPFSLAPLLLWHFLYFLIFTAVAYLFYRLASERLRALLGPALAVLAISAWVYTYLLPGDYGVLDVALFSHPGRLIGFHRLYGGREKLLQLGEIFALLFSGVGIYYLARRFTQHSFAVVLILSLMSLGQTAANVVTSPGLLSIDNRDNDAAFLPDYTEAAYRLSKEKNVILIMMDMFTGGFIPEMFDSYPELATDFAGFTWYPNTVSLGTATFAGLPGILGGHKYSPPVVNANPGIPMSQRLSESFSVYSQAFNEKGFDSVYVHPVYYNLEEEAEVRNITVVQPESFTEYWVNTDEEASSLNLKLTAGQYSGLFSVVGLFKAAPHFLRPFIYTEGRWLNFNRGDLNIRNAVNHLAFLSLLSELSAVDDGKPAFKYIGNELTHVPWAIDENLRLTRNTVGGRRYFPEYDFQLIDRDGPYYSSVRALKELAEYFEWMRREKVFDNTKIVIVSDHGYYGPSPMWPDIPVVRADDGTGVEGSAAYHSILMVKDFDSSGTFNIDERLMSTADTTAIVLSGLDIPEWISADPTRGKAQNREVITTLTPVPPEENTKDGYIINYQFTISGDPSQKVNWRQDIP